MALKGRLRDFNLTQLLNLVNLARKSGSLKIAGADGHATLYFRDGKLVFASLDGRRAASGELVDLLVRGGRISAAQLQTLRAEGRAHNDKELGLMLINAGAVSQKDILQALRNHLLEVVYAVFGWEDGTFEFHQQVDLPPGRIAVPISLENIILEGRKRREELAELEAELPSMEITLRFAENPDLTGQKISVTPDEWRVISLVNSRTTLAQIAEKNNMGEFQVRRIVSKLLRNGLVEVANQPTGSRGRGGFLGRKSDAVAEPVKEPLPQQPAQPKVARGIIQRLIARIRGL